ncbi:hypothetical protein Tco_1453509 [Tanacetum coccineum]
MAILMVQPWQKVARKRITQSFSLDPEILFPPLGDEDGTEDPMIIEAEIGGHFIHRIYVDEGSASEILMVQPWQKVASQRITQSFSLDPKISFPPLGDEDGTEDPMIIEAEIGGHFIHRIYMDEGSASEILKNKGCGAFNLYVDEFCGSKITISVQWDHRKAGVRKIQAVPSTAHEMLKLPVPGGILTLRSSRIIPLECTMVSEPKA